VLFRANRLNHRFALAASLSVWLLIGDKSGDDGPPVLKRRLRR
jgi:hypothetical protein